MLNMTISSPPRGDALNDIRSFLNKSGLIMGDDADYTVCLYDDEDELCATGSLCGRVLKYIATSPAAQGEGAAAKVVSELVNEAARRGIIKLFLFTKPDNITLFKSLGFYPLAKTDKSAMLENSRNGLSRFLSGIDPGEGVKGAIVANCNPFTLGHRWLMEKAALVVDTLHVFVLSEDLSRFTSKERFMLVKEGTSDIKNIRVHMSGDYLISHATFPTYFIKEQDNTAAINADLDITLFGTKIAPVLGITKRFVGTEPYCMVTSAYNKRLHELLPGMGVEVVELERKDGISASLVRKLEDLGDIEGIRALVPNATFEYICKKHGWTI
ncbi:MAG: [Clostridia bacterium]|nr:[citrate (pro-3S)-lyase] ligase [Clostridia bacterium]